MSIIHTGGIRMKSGPDNTTKCVLCGKPIRDEPYICTKNKGRADIYAHGRCYYELLTRKGNKK